MARIKKQKRALYARGWSPTAATERLAYQHPIVPDPLADAERAMARVRPKHLRRRIVSVLRWADRISPTLLDVQHHPGLLALAGQPWLRPLDRLADPGVGTPELVQHLLWRYPSSAMWAQPFGAQAALDQASRRTLARISVLVGGGCGLRQVQRAGLLPVGFTRRMFHSWLSAVPWTPIVEALRRAQVEALGGPPWLAEALLEHGLDRLQPSEHAWLERIAWLCQRGIERDHVQPIIAYLQARDAPVRGRGATAVLRDAIEWRLTGRRVLAPSRPFRAAGFGQVPPDQPEDGVTWSSHELRSYMALWKEGRALKHCVATYGGMVRSGHSSIWSVRRDGVRCLTVEVLQRHRRIIQIRGRYNRPPTDIERSVVRSWAEANQLEIVEH